MNILVLNRGSSSLKCALYALFQLPEKVTAPAWQEKIEWETTKDAGQGELEAKIRSALSGKRLCCVGHRIVQGGKQHKESALITPQLKQEIHDLSDLAPLHNLANLEGVEMVERLFPAVPQIAVFDTAFHQTLPEAATVYPGPYEWIEQGIVRYGFHGISFQYCTTRATQLLGHVPEKMVICHLGSGASLCALKNGQSVDTTMGFTPLEGLMMDTRSGTVDPGILLYLLEKRGKTAQQLSHDLYEKSGLLGLSGTSSDMRDVLEKASNGDPRARLAIDVYLHRLTSMIGSMVVSTGGLDALVFTGGIGENASLIREQICQRLAFLGIKCRDDKNAKEDCVLSASDSKVKVLLIHTQEAFEIARECWKLLSHSV